MIDLDMVMACTPNMAPTTMERVIHVESRDGPLAPNVNVKWVIEHDEKGQPIIVTDKDDQPKPKRHKVALR